MPAVLPPPTGDAKNPPTDVTLWGKFFTWIYLLWQWVTQTIPGRLTFGGDAGSYSAALFASAGQSDIGGLGMIPGIKIAVSARNTNGQSISNGTVTVITNWTNVFDNSGGQWSASGGTFTCTTPGVYLCSAKFRLGNANTGATFEVTSVIRKNGADTCNAEAYNAASNASAPSGTAVGIFVLAQGDTLQPCAYQSSGASQNLSTTAQFSQVSIMQIL